MAKKLTNPTTASLKKMNKVVNSRGLFVSVEILDDSVNYFELCTRLDNQPKLRKIQHYDMESNFGTLWEYEEADASILARIVWQTNESGPGWDETSVIVSASTNEGLAEATSLTILNDEDDVFEWLDS
jgi:hypothetical protein